MILNMRRALVKTQNNNYVQINLFLYFLCSGFALCDSLLKRTGGGSEIVLETLAELSLRLFNDFVEK